MVCAFSPSPSIAYPYLRTWLVLSLTALPGLIATVWVHGQGKPFGDNETGKMQLRRWRAGRAPAPGVRDPDMSRQLSKPWRVVKWTGVVVSLLLGCGWACSVFWSVSIGRGHGAFLYVHGPDRATASAGYLYLTYHRYGDRDWTVEANRISDRWEPDWFERFGLCWRWQFEINDNQRPIGLASGVDLLIPFWMLCLPVSVATFVLFYLDRRPPKGHCRNCGYDLTGNESGVCPECGKTT